MDFPVPQVKTNIYMEYFDELPLGPQCPITTSWWKRYLYDVNCITKKDQLDILFNHINNMDDHIKITMECPDNQGSIPFLDTKCTLNSNHTINTTVYRIPKHTDRYLAWDSSHPIRSVIQALINRAKMVCSNPELLAMKMDYLNKILHRNIYSDWFLKKPNHRPLVDQATNHETVPYLAAQYSNIAQPKTTLKLIYSN